MNSLEISNLMKRNKHTKNKFKGVFASDNLPKQNIQKPACFIINTDPSSLPGTHWVAIYFPKIGKTYYFDSFGVRPSVKSIISFISRNSTHYEYNKKQLQNVFSVVCGNYCCEYLFHRCQGKSNISFFKRYNSNSTVKNDDSTMKHFKTHFKNQRTNILKKQKKKTKTKTNKQTKAKQKIKRNSKSK